MLEQYVRHPYQRWCVNRVADLLGPYLSATQITVAAGLTGIVSMFCLIYGYQSLAILFLLLSGYADTLDGTVARREGQSSPAGAVFDIMTDRVVEFAIILGLFLIAPQARGLLCMLMLGSVLLCVTSFLVVGIFTPNDSEKSFHYSAGLMERAEAFIMFILMILLPDYFRFLAVLFLALILLTTIIRVFEFYSYATSSLRHDLHASG